MLIDALKRMPFIFMNCKNANFLDRKRNVRRNSYKTGRKCLFHRKTSAVLKVNGSLDKTSVKKLETPPKYFASSFVQISLDYTIETDYVLVYNAL